MPRIIRPKALYSSTCNGHLGANCEDVYVRWRSRIPRTGWFDGTSS